MSRWLALLAAGLLALAPSARAGAARPAPSLVPSAILLVTLDTTRADHLGVHGYERPTSPALDALAREGVRARMAVSPMPTTDPAHASLFTGLYPRSHGILHNGVPLRDGVPNLARWARERGYATAAFVSRAHVQPDALNLAGFDHQSGAGGHVRDGAETLAAAEAWLDAHGSEPFFVWVHFFDPHTPYEPKPELAARFVPPELRDEPPARDARRGHYTPAQIRANVARYDAEIAYVDGLVGRLVARVRRAREGADPPLIVLAGDHGEAMGELEARHRYAFNHGSYLYQGIVHVPLFLVWPGRLPAGRVLEGPVELVDVPATLFDLVGAPGFVTQGESLLPWIEERSEARRYAFSHRRSDGQPARGADRFAVQDERHKLVRGLNGEKEELYDLVEDPGETRNLAEELPAVRKRLRAALDAWLERVPPSDRSDLDVRPERVEALEALGYVE